MKVTGCRKLLKQLDALPKTARVHLTGAVDRNLEAGLKTAKILAPKVTGDTDRALHIEKYENELGGEIVAVRSDAPRAEKDKRYAIEYGRKGSSGDLAAGTFRNRGTTTGFLYMTTARKFLAKRFKRSLRRAINKAAKEVVGGGGGGQ